MARESKDTVKKSIAIDSKTYVWIMNFATRYGIDYTAAVNLLLVQAKERIEAMEAADRRAEEARAEAMENHAVLREQEESRERAPMTRVGHIVKKSVEENEDG
jgi:hypothetical protein